jgi:hypothetical protein
MRTTLASLALVAVLGSLIALSGGVTFAQQPGAAPAPVKPTVDAPVWKAGQLGQLVERELELPPWNDPADGEEGGVDPAELALQRKVIEAHAVGQGFVGPFGRRIARQAFGGYMKQRFDGEEHEAVLKGLEMWGVAYSSAIELAAGDQAQLQRYIRHVFGNAVKVDKASDLTLEASVHWDTIVARVEEICRRAMQTTIIVPEDED